MLLQFMILSRVNHVKEGSLFEAGSNGNWHRRRGWRHDAIAALPTCPTFSGDRVRWFDCCLNLFGLYGLILLFAVLDHRTMVGLRLDI